MSRITPAAELKKQWEGIGRGKYTWPLAFRREYHFLLANETYAVYELYVTSAHKIEYTINDYTGEITNLTSTWGPDTLGAVQISTSAAFSTLITAKQF